MKRLATVLAAALVSLTGFAVGTASAGESFYAYTQPGTWFAPGAKAGTYYDWCGYWRENTFSKGSSSYGLITFIDLNGNWNFGKQGLGTLTRRLTVSESRAFVKKLHCRNNSGSGYQGGCFGFIESAQCA